MGRPAIDLTGHRYGIMTVIGRDLSVRGGASVSSRWIVRCGCGNERSISSNVLRTLHQKSCGCLRGKHEGKYGIPMRALQRWTNMMRRCYQPTSHKDARNYRGRGIAVCVAWHDPKVFYGDIGDPPFGGATLDRINNNGNYEPSNVRWATWTQQNKNRRPFGGRHRHVA